MANKPTSVNPKPMSNNVNATETRARPNQVLPKGHFDSDGVSQGRRSGPDRPAYDGSRGAVSGDIGDTK